MVQEHATVKACIVTTAFPRWWGHDRGTFVFEAACAAQVLGVQVRVTHETLQSPGI